MQDLVTFITKSLVERPDQVEVQCVAGEEGDVYELGVAESDLGLVIGRQGRTAKALRAVVRAGAAKQGKRATLEILE